MKPFSFRGTTGRSTTAQRLPPRSGRRRRPLPLTPFARNCCASSAIRGAWNRSNSAGRPSRNRNPVSRSWAAVIVPHEDVRSGELPAAPVPCRARAGDAGTPGLNTDPEDFYRRTFLTTGIRSLVRSAMLRLSGRGGDPVIELQTNFGGGKTHSMLALYHLFGPVRANRLPGVEELMRDFGVEELPKGSGGARSTHLSPGEPREKRTVHGPARSGERWRGNSAGRTASAIVARSDERG